MVGSEPTVSNSLVLEQTPACEPRGNALGGRRRTAAPGSASLCRCCCILGPYSPTKLQRQSRATGRWVKLYSRNSNNTSLIGGLSCRPTYILLGNLVLWPINSVTYFYAANFCSFS
jgi:hypothetical protein